MSNKEGKLNEALIISGIKKGDEAVFKHLFDTMYHQLVVFAARFLQDFDLARNVVQDVFVKLYDKRDELNIHTSLKAHLYQSVKNRCLNVIKRNNMEQEHHQYIVYSTNETIRPQETLEFEDLQNTITSTIEKLPKKCRKIFKMSRNEGMSNQEISDRLDISKRTVETQISKALKALRTELTKKEML
ncbi:RNA polymerase sigma-70 factor [Marinilabiliaceae bacterium ANBcel2]|nr:RNA polymerase sigma-70 factor [Marinilabiliaceae bacterium ANBcel2]